MRSEIPMPLQCPDIRYGTRYAGGTTPCAGCGQSIDCNQHYLTLHLANHDGTLLSDDYAFTCFHSEQCLALCVQRGEHIASTARAVFHGERGMARQEFARAHPERSGFTACRALVHQEAQSYLDTFYYA